MPESCHISQRYSQPIDPLVHLHHQVTSTARTESDCSAHHRDYELPFAQLLAGLPGYSIVILESDFVTQVLYPILRLIYLRMSGGVLYDAIP